MSTRVGDEYSFFCALLYPDGTKSETLRISIQALRGRAGLTCEQVREDREEAKSRLEAMLRAGLKDGYRWSTGW